MRFKLSRDKISSLLITIIIAITLPKVITHQFSSNYLKYGGIALNEHGKTYEITTKECPGGIFLTQRVNENCLCYHGIFAIVRECCTSGVGLITTETLEWRNNYQCGISPEIKALGVSNYPIKAILPLTNAKAPFKPVLTFLRFVGNDFNKWQKFDLEVLAASPKPPVFHVSDVEIINIRPQNQEVKFRMGKFGDIDLCYNGWETNGKPQTLRISVYTYAKRSQKEAYCCFQIQKDNVPGVVFSSCRGGSLLVEIVDIESVDKGSSCHKSLNIGRSSKSNSWSSKYPNELVRFKRSETQDVEQESDGLENDNPFSTPATTDVNSGGEGNGTDEIPLAPIPIARYPINELEKDSFQIQRTKLRIFSLIRKRGFKEVTREPTTQRFIMLKKAFKLFTQIVPDEMFPKQMAEEGFESFYYLYEGYDIDFQRLSSEEFKRVLGLLDKCKANVKPWPTIITYHNATCPQKAVSFSSTALLNGSSNLTAEDSDYSSLIVSDEIEGAFKELVGATGAPTDIGVTGSPNMEDNTSEAPSSDLKMTTEVFADDVSVTDATEIKSTTKNKTGNGQIPIKMPPHYFQFDPAKHDMIVEMNWKFVNFIHTICFKEFFNDYNAHHFFEHQMELLFLMKMIQKRWFRDTNKAGDYTQGIISNYHKYSRMVELDKAMGIAHNISRYTRYLQRPKNEDLQPFSEIHKKAKLYQEAVQMKVDILNKLKQFENGELEIKERANDIEQDVPSSIGMLPEFEGDDSIVRHKKTIGGHTQGKGRSMRDKGHKELKPGSIIWDGKAICLFANSNADPAYYSQKELWGTKPSLTELGRQYP